jgi:hypothetical protein
MVPKGEFMGSNFGSITGPFFSLAYCLAAFSKQFEHLKQQNICPSLYIKIYNLGSECFIK